MFRQVKDTRLALQSVLTSSDIAALSIHIENDGVVLIKLANGCTGFTCVETGLNTPFFSPAVLTSPEFGESHDALMRYLASGDIANIGRDMHPAKRDALLALLERGVVVEKQPKDTVAHALLKQIHAVVGQFLENYQ